MDNILGNLYFFNNSAVSTILLLLITGVAIISAWVDHRSRILPDRLTAMIAVLSAVVLFLAREGLTGTDIAIWLVVVAVHVVLVIAPPYGLGGGDLKLIAAMGLSATSLSLLLPWLVLSYTLAAFEGLRRRFSKDSSTLAFGPWLVTAWIVIFMGESACVAMANCR